MTITWLDDGRHSEPTALTIEGTDGQTVTAELAGGERRSDGTVTATVALPDLSGPWVVRVDAVTESTTPNYFSSVPQALPLGIVEVALGGVEFTAPAAPGTMLDDVCRDALLVLDGTPLPVRLSATVGEALNRAALDIVACDTVDLSAGIHRLDAVPGAGFDVDRVLFAEAATRVPVVAVGSAITDQTRTTARIEVEASAVPAWLVLAESWNRGCAARGHYCPVSERSSAIL